MKWLVARKAMAMLESAEIDFAIVTPDDEVHGNLDVRREGDSVPEAKPKRAVVNDWVAETDYVNKLKMLKIGDVLELDIENPDETAAGNTATRAYSFSAVVQNACYRYFGKENYLLTRDGGHLEVMRT